MLAINADKIYTFGLWQPGDFPSLHRVNEFFADTFPRLVDVLAHIIKDRKCMELFEILTHQTDNLQFILC